MYTGQSVPLMQSAASGNGACSAVQPRAARLAVGCRRRSAASGTRCCTRWPNAYSGKASTAPRSSTLHASSSSVDAAPDAHAEAPPFRWTNAWYPLAPLSYLDPSRPSAHIVLGHSLAIWRDPSTDEWVAFADRCPHRLAPLSEGRIDAATGTLQCSYHGWQFNAAGACTHIPQADSASQERDACSSTRTCVARYPTRVDSGLVWVWLESGEDGAVLSAAQRPALPSELASGEGVLLGDWFMRELPISYEFLAENLLDPSHVHFSHHGVIGSRGKATPLQLRPTDAAADASRGSTFEIMGNTLAGGATSLSHFIPPSLAWLELGRAGAQADAHASLIFYAIPVSPGRSRIISGYATNALPPALRAALRSPAIVPLMHAFQWAADLGQHEVLDGDTLLLRYQEERARQTTDGGQRVKYFMPAGADRAVQAFRAWVDTAEGDGPRYGPAAAPLGPSATIPPLSRREILDRYTQHTVFCPHCSKAFNTVRALRMGLAAAAHAGAGAALVLGVLQATLPQLSLAPGAAVRSGSALAFAAAALGCAAVNEALRHLEQRFTFTDYVHAEK